MSSDDAGNGRRGSRATPSPPLSALLGERYGLETPDPLVDLGGSSNLNLLVSRGGERYVARVYRPYVSAARLEAIQRVRRELVQGGVPCAEAVSTRDGEPWVRLGDRLVEVERFIEIGPPMDSWERLERGLPWLGRIHSLLREVQVDPDGARPEFANHIEPFDTREGMERSARRVRGWGPTPDELRLLDAAQELAQRVVEAERDLAPRVRRQLVHGDFWDNNVFFRDGQVALVTDFDFMGERARIDDLALTLYFTNSTFGDDPISAARRERLRQLVDAYASGLDEALTDVERVALPLALARQPLWWVGRWLWVLDDVQEARQGFAGMSQDVTWALQVVRDLERWQDAFA